MPPVIIKPPVDPSPPPPPPPPPVLQSVQSVPMMPPLPPPVMPPPVLFGGGGGAKARTGTADQIPHSAAAHAPPPPPVEYDLPLEDNDASYGEGVHLAGPIYGRNRPAASDVDGGGVASRLQPPPPVLTLPLPPSEDLPAGPILGGARRKNEEETRASSSPQSARKHMDSVPDSPTSPRKGLFGVVGGSIRNSNGNSNKKPAAPKVVIQAAGPPPKETLDPEFKLYDEADLDKELAKDREARRPDAPEVVGRKANLNRISQHMVHLRIEEVNEASLPPPPPPLESIKFDEADEDVLTLRVCERRGWRTMPTQNPHVMRALIKELNPWKSPDLLLSSPHMSDAVRRNIYSTPKTIVSATEFVPSEHDVIVCGPPRAGQTPVLHALCSLRSGVPSTKSDVLLEQTKWLEGPGATPATSTGLCKTGGGAGKGRLIKTHMSPPRGGGDEHKIVAVLRDPKDLRVSWFRHVRRLFTKTYKGKKKIDFDGKFYLNDFCQQVTLGNLLGPSDCDYEDTVLEMARAPQTVVCIVFYEEIIASPRKVVERLANFTGWGKGSEDLINNITQAIVQDKNHPSRKKRFGSCGSGQDLLSNEVTRSIDEKWRARIQKKFKQFGEYATYQDMFFKVTGVPFPFGGNVVEDVRLQSLGELGSMRNSSGSAASPKPSSIRKPGGAGAPEAPPRKGGAAAPAAATAAAATGAGQAMMRYPKPATTKVVKFPDPDQSDDEPDMAAAGSKKSLMSRISSRISSRIR